MSEEQEHGQEQEQQEQQEQEQQQPEVVSLPKDQYDVMMANMANMQAQLSAMAQAQQKPQEPAQPEITPEDLDKLSQAELVNHIMAQIQQQNTPVMQAVMNMAVQLELQEVANKYDDFDTYKDQVYAIASENTSIGLEQAYLMCKGKTPPPAKKEEPEQESKKADPPPPAHRTSTPKTEVHNDQLLDPMAAAKAAAEKLGYGKD